MSLAELLSDELSLGPRLLVLGSKGQSITGRAVVELTSQPTCALLSQKASKLRYQHRQDP